MGKRDRYTRTGRRRKQGVSDQEAPTEVSTARADLAQRTYTQVLDATKHQDDKVGRFLTAIAFLTTGSIALGATDEGLQGEYSVRGGEPVPLLAAFVGLFLALTLASVVLFLLCLSVPVRQPRRVGGSMTGSRLFYQFIAPRPKDEWKRDWQQTCTKCLTDAFENDYINESHNLAERTSAKYRHSHEASWLFVMALLILGTSIALKIFAVVQGSQETVSLGTGSLATLAACALLHLSLQVYTRAVHDVRSMLGVRDHARLANNLPMIDTQLSQQRAGEYPARRAVGLLLVPAVAYLTLIVFPWGESMHKFWVVPAVLSVTIAGYRIITRSRTSLERGSAINAVITVLMVALSSGVALGALVLQDFWLAGAVLTPAIVFAAVNTARPAMSQRQTRQVVRAQALDEERQQNRPLPVVKPKRQCRDCAALKN